MRTIPLYTSCIDVSTCGVNMNRTIKIHRLHHAFSVRIKDEIKNYGKS